MLGPIILEVKIQVYITWNPLNTTYKKQTPQCTVLFQKPTDAQLLKNFPLIPEPDSSRVCF
jgi:hypothetical protein